MPTTNRTRIVNRNGILVAEWVNLNPTPAKERRDVAKVIGQVIEHVIPRPDLQKQPAVKVTPWRGSK